MKQRLLLGLVAGALMSVTSAANAAEYLITSVTELTSVMAAQGIPLSRGMKVAADQINASGYLGADKIKLVQYDNGGDRGQSVLLVRRAAEEGSLAIIGTGTGYSSYSIGPVANELKVPLMGMVYAPDLLSPGPWSLKMTSSDDSHTFSVARYALAKGKPQRCMIIYARDNPGFVAQYKTFTAFMEKEGVKFVGDYESLSLQDTDFSAIATKVASLKPDCLHISTIGGQAANIILQALSAGMSPTTKIYSTSVANNAFLQVGGKAVDGTIIASDYAPGGLNEEGKQFEADYIKAYGTPPENWSAVGYSQVKLIAWAIKQSSPNVTRERIRDAIANVKDWPTILGSSGKVSITDRLPEYPAAIITAKDGKFVPAPQ